MNMRDLAPWARSSSRERHTLPALQEQTANPVFALHREMNRLFDDVLRDFGSPSLWRGTAWPQVEVEERDNEYRVTAELAGLDEKDVEVFVDDDALILRGEKRAEIEDRTRAFSERVYGRFERRIPLYGVDEIGAGATFRNGVLTVTIPKSAQGRERGKRVPINQDSQSGTTH